MDASEGKIMDNCRICDVLVTDGDFVSLFTISGQVFENTYSGELFEELIQLRSTEHTNYPFICNGCDLQMKLFKRLKEKAWSRFAKKTDDNGATNDALGLDKNSKHTIEVVNNSTGNLENVDKYSNDSEKTVNIENKDFLVVYNVKGQSLHSVNIDDLIELENCEEDENTIDIENVKCDEVTSTSLEVIPEENELLQNFSNDIEPDIVEKPQEIRLKSTECKECGLNFSSVRSFKSHRQEEHGRTHPCKVCQKLFKTADNLEGHMRKHMGLPAYQCKDCNKTFNQKVHYQYHMKRHKNIRDFACSACDKSYFSKSDLTMHVKRAHEGEKNFVCCFQNCGKRFFYEQHLKYHSYVHSGQKNFLCDYKDCQQRFTAPNALAIHKKTIHSSEFKFACSQCNKTFRRKHHLEGHFLVHENQNESPSSRHNNLLSRKVNINQGTEITNHLDEQTDGDSEMDENTLQTINDQSDDNDFLMDVIESCSETDNQNETESYNYC